jgi:hypothetical protein
MKFRMYLVCLFAIIVIVLVVTSSAQADVTVVYPPPYGIPVAVATDVQETSPAVAYDPGRRQYLVAFNAYTFSTSVIKATCLNQFGEIVASYTLGKGIHPDVVFDPAHDMYMVIWENHTSGRIDAVNVSGSCCPSPSVCVGIPFTVTGDRPGYEAWPSIAYNAHAAHQDFLIVWHDDENTVNTYGVWGRRMITTTLKGESFHINHPESSYNYAADVG